MYTLGLPFRLDAIVLYSFCQCTTRCVHKLNFSSCEKRLGRLSANYNGTGKKIEEKHKLDSISGRENVIWIECFLFFSLSPRYFSCCCCWWWCGVVRKRNEFCVSLRVERFTVNDSVINISVLDSFAIMLHNA